MTPTIVPTTKIQIIKMEPKPNCGWFRNMIEDLFVPDPLGRLSSQQIAEIFNHHYIELGLPDLSTNCREVGRQLAKNPDIGRSNHKGIVKYHLSLKDESKIPALIKEQQTRVKAYRRTAQPAVPTTQEITV